MASEDVIELGSSDDETEPAPKKIKPMPNAMVCIPRNLHEVTIKPAKLNIGSAQKAGKVSKGGPTSKEATVLKNITLPKGVSLTKAIPIKPANTTNNRPAVQMVPVAKKKVTQKASSLVTNPFATKTKSNGKATQNRVVKQNLKTTKTVIRPVNVPNFPRITSTTSMARTATVMKNPIKILNSNSLNNLPSGITVKRTTMLNKKPVIFLKAPTLIQNKQPVKKPNVMQIVTVPTVELDDDDSASTTSSPAWYIRPEEQTEETTLEEENNAEPETPKMIEITIEDSPIKPFNKRNCEIGAELAITIDDSPIKAIEKNASPSGSDNETSTSKEPNSRKKLNYPKEAESDSRKTVEIEIDFPYEVSLDTSSIRSQNSDQQETVVVVEVPTEPNQQHSDKGEKSTEKETNSVAIKENKTETPSTSSISSKTRTESEFHSVYQSFIDLCFQLENSDDMKKIVDKKIKAYYRQVPKSFTESEEFIDMVSSKVLAMKASPDKMYLYIKDIVDELNMQRKVTKSQVAEKETITEEPKQFEFKEENEYDSRRRRQIRKLEKTIKKLHRAIQKLEEQEVDFEDEDDSVYLLTERYKERMMRVYAKFCQLTNTKMPSEPRVQIDARPGRPSGPAKRLEKWINKKVPIGTPLPFPDFHDVLRCVREANTEDKLDWNEADIMEEARDLFTRCGKKLQRRRQENEWRLAASRITSDVDPAENNDQLKSKLEENKRLAAKRETDIFNKYADRQNQLKLEAVEIGDKEAEESPLESEEEVNDETVSLENKGKRKERLKRLIQEISKGSSEEKNNETSKEPEIEASSKKTEDDNVDENKTETNEETKTEDKESKGDSGNTIENNQDKENSHNATETLSVSDESDNLESDVDELHLLQKLHSANEDESSTLESSNSDSPIAISDSLDSDSDDKKQLSDVISIENSSFSESEADKGDSKKLQESDSVQPVDADSPPKKTETCIVGIETDSPKDVETSLKEDDRESCDLNTINTLECKESENILLASSDEESQGEEPSPDSVCINLKDDLISIDETVVGTGLVEPIKESESAANGIISEKEVNDTEKDSINDVNANNHLKDDNEVKENVNNNEAIDTSHSKAPSATHEESIQKDEQKSVDTVTYMDVDPTDKELETIRLQEIIQSTSSL